MMENDRDLNKQRRFQGILNAMKGAAKFGIETGEISTVSSIRDLSELIQCLIKCDMMSNPADYLYRGESQLYSSHLLPTLIRQPQNEYKTYVLGTTTYNITMQEIKFVSKILEKLQNQKNLNSIQQDDSAWLPLAQHYGQPTRLLDVTRNPLVALFFACIKLNNSKQMWNSDRDGVIYAIPTKTMVRQCSEYDKKGQEDELIPDKYLDLFGTSADIDDMKKPVIKWLDTYVRDVQFNRRLKAQNGSFIWWHPVEKAYPKELEGFVSINIKKEFKDSILRELSGLGVRPDSLFPDSEGVGWQYLLDNQLKKL